MIQLTVNHLHRRANNHLWNSGRKSTDGMTCSLFTFSLQSINLIWKVILPTYPFSTETVITMLYYCWPHSIYTADPLLVKLHHHPRLSWFVRSQWVELSQVTLELIDGNKSTFLWERKKDERDRSMWWGGILSDCSWWQIRYASWYEAICSPRCLDAVGYNCTLNCVTCLEEVTSSSGGLSLIFTLPLMFSMALSKLCRLCLC